MNGIRYQRITNGISLSNLSDMTGISIPTLRKMEKMEVPKGVYAENYRKVSEALKVSVDDLIRNNYPEIEVQRRAYYPSRTANLSNCISVYRNEKKMSFQRLASILGVNTRERARQVCAADKPLKKHLEALAKYEKISVQEFLDKYSLRKEAF